MSLKVFPLSPQNAAMRRGKQPRISKTNSKESRWSVAIFSSGPSKFKYFLSHRIFTHRLWIRFNTIQIAISRHADTAALSGCSFIGRLSVDKPISLGIRRSIATLMCASFSFLRVRGFEHLKVWSLWECLFKKRISKKSISKQNLFKASSSKKPAFLSKQAVSSAKSLRTKCLGIPQHQSGYP